MTASGISLQMGWSSSTVGRWESGVRMPSPADAAALLTALGVDAETRDELVAMARDKGERHWLAVGLPEQARALSALLEAERDAAEITTVAPNLVPGMLQTTAYARAILGAGGVPEHEVEPRVRVRVGRREVLRDQNPPRLTTMIGEGALRRLVGGRKVMAHQLRTLLDIAALPVVDLRIVPFTADWAPDLEGMFDMFAFRDDREPVVHLENRRSALVLHEPDDVEAYRAAADIVMSVAMSPEASAGLIADVAESLEGTS